MNWIESVRLTVSRTHRSFHEVCRAKGSAGGRKAAANKRRARLVLEARELEKLRQLAQRTESPDALPDALLSTQDQINMSNEGRQARLRVARLCPHETRLSPSNRADISR
jgi:hypothetical protein